jgi:pimeloyl-ACP methyl ester carboxylesterase
MWKMTIVLLWLSAAVIACGGSSDKVASYADPAPHEVGFVTLESGVRLHYLDFGGSGDALLFLAGAGNSAHVYDDFAPLFTDTFHVLVLTRRGFGDSSQPDSAYDTETLANDIHGFLSALNIDRAVIVGHSIAGAEMTRFAVNNPEQVIKLIYLDAAYDWAVSAESLDAGNQPVPPGPSNDQLVSPGDFASYVAWTSGVTSFPEAEIRATNRFKDDGEYEGPVTPSEISIALATGAAAEHPGYAELTAPVLAFYTVPDSVTDMFPWLTPDAAGWEDAEAFFSDAAASLAKQRAAFVTQLPQATVVELHGVPHFLFLAQPDDLAARMLEFLR